MKKGALLLRLWHLGCTKYVWVAIHDTFFSPHKRKCTVMVRPDSILKNTYHQHGTPPQPRRKTQTKTGETSLQAPKKERYDENTRDSGSEPHSHATTTRLWGYRYQIKREGAAEQSPTQPKRKVNQRARKCQAHFFTPDRSHSCKLPVYASVC